MKSKIKLLLVLFIISLSYNLLAQERLFKIEDVQNRKYYPKGIYDIKFMSQSDSYSFTKDGQSLWIGTKKDAPKEAIKLSDINPMPMTLFGINYISDKEFTYSTNSGEVYIYNLETKTSKKLYSLEEGWKNIEVNNKTNNIAFTENYNLYILINGEKKQITTDGSRDMVYGDVVHRNEFGIEKGLFWSNDGNRLAFYKMDQSMVSDYPLVNTEERIAKYSLVKYPMAGMKSHEVLVGVYDIKTGKTIYLNTRKDESVEEKEAFLTNIAFSVDGKIIYIAKLNRLQNHLSLEAYSTETGEKIKVLFEEKSEKYVEPEAPMVFIPNNPNQFLWLSERDGYNHIYIYNSDGSGLIKQLTKGKWMINSIEGFNKKGNEVFVYATKDSPLERHLYGINLNSGEIKRYSSGKGVHSVVFNANGNLFLDTYSNYDSVSSKTQVLDNKGKIISVLNESEDPLKDIYKPKIELSSIKAKDGTELYYRMIKPHDFDPKKKYPVLVYVYGGPHAQLVTDNWLAGANNFFLFLAQQGYIIWTLDNRGSANRGLEFESAIWHNCGSIEIDDQMEGINYLKTLPYIDSERIGVDGWSYGGFMTISLMLKNPGVFKTATAGGPVIDWKWYEIMYGERYMGTPENNSKGYENASLLNYIDNLKGKLLIIQGYQDATVVPQHCIEFIRLAIKKGKQLDFFLYPDHEHNVRGKDRIHLYQKIFEYHKANL